MRALVFLGRDLGSDPSLGLRLDRGLKGLDLRGGSGEGGSRLDELLVHVAHEATSLAATLTPVLHPILDGTGIIVRLSQSSEFIRNIGQGSLDSHLFVFLAAFGLTPEIGILDL